LYRTGTRQGAFVSDDWSVVGLPHRPIYLYHADVQKEPDLVAPSDVVAHFELDIGRWLLVNEGLDDASVVKGTQVAPFKLDARVELEPETKIIFGRDERFRAGHIRMLYRGLDQSGLITLPVARGRKKT
jgi:hypothetical protein